MTCHPPIHTGKKKKQEALLHGLAPGPHA